MLSLDKMCIMAYQTIMINKDGFSTTYVLWWLNPELFPKEQNGWNMPEPTGESKIAETCLSLPAESKIAEKMLEPADEGS